MIHQRAAPARAEEHREALMAASSSNAHKNPLLAGAGEYPACWPAQHKKAAVFVTLDPLPRTEEAQPSASTAPSSTSWPWTRRTAPRAAGTSSKR
ncbi:hypothetical protein ACWCXX_27760 [Streptomyces sp. NPDC001732]